VTVPDPRLADVHARMALAVSGDGAGADRLYAWLRYQLGWAEADGRPADVRRGKGVRPLLALTACEAVGGDPLRAVPVAAAIELTHEFSLVHDDIQDDDHLRRGRPTLWTVCGVPQGITAGDALWAIARRELGATRAPGDVLVDIFARYDAACLRLAEGQHLDLAFEARDDVTVSDYVDMVSRKTGALLAAAASMGGRAGGAPREVADGLARFGEALGIAFQIQDDVLGLWGDPARTGKPVGADLLRRKKSLPVLLGSADPATADEIARLYRSGEPEPPDAARVAAAMQAAGLRERASRLAHDWAAEAARALEPLPLRPGPRAELAAVVERAVTRER
jgi:geranylgeranyl diphosphate synthase, type I